MNAHPRTLFLGLVTLVLFMSMAGCNRSPEVPPAVPGGASANVEDADVTTNVKTALLRDADLKGFDINVITLKGDVRLIGVVDKQSQIDAAITLARAASGVHSIHDELSIKK